MSDSDEESSVSSASDYDSSDEESNTSSYTIDPSKEYMISDCLIPSSIFDEILTEDILKICEEERSETDSLYYNPDTCNEVYLSEQVTQCTYKEGYMKRQNIYTCVDCNNKNNQLSALCFACAMCCHRKHYVLELYSKRNYRCDCGNEKFGLFTCRLYPEKDIFNSKNLYNDNFRGIYCVCKQPYENNSKDENDLMIQCVICEDWYHTKHLDVNPPRDCKDKLNFDEFICFLCTNKYSYFSKYNQLLNFMKSNNNNMIKDTSCDKEKENFLGNNDYTSESGSLKCLIKDIPIKLPYTSIFMSSGWRNFLCQCADCISMYQHHDHMFLLDKDDVLMSDGEPFEFVRSPINSPNTENELIDKPIMSHDQYNNQTSMTAVTAPPNTSNVDKDDPKTSHRITDDSTSQTDLNNENNLSSDPNIDDYLKGIFLKKRPVKVHDPNAVVKDFQRKKRPKYEDDDQNL